MRASEDHSGAHPGASGRTPQRATRIVAAALLVVYGLLVAGVAARLGTTVDEPKYFNGGRLILRDGWDDPTTRLQGPLPLLAAQLLVPDFPDDRYERADNAASLFLRGRLGLLPFALLGALVVFVWSRRLFGERGGLVSLALCVLSPLVIGHAALVTVDVAFAACVLLALYLAWRFLARPTVPRALGVGAALGAALATKYLALLYAPFVVLAVAVGAWRKRSTRATPPVAAAAAAALASAATLVTLHACYGFCGSLAERDAAVYDSEAVARLVGTPVVGRLLGLLPRPFLLGVDLQASIGDVEHRVYLNGTFAPGQVGYYAWALACKTPELVLLLVLVTAVLHVPRWFGRGAPPDWRSAAWVLVPPSVALFVYLSAFTTLQIGIRYVLPLLPAAFVACGVLAWTPDGRRPPPLRLAWLGATLAQSALAVAFAWPNLLAYYNTASGGMPAAYRHFADSNSEWGQSDGGGTAAMRAGHYDLLTSFSGPRLGRVAIRLADRVLADPEDPSRRWHWLDALTPAETFEAAFWAYDLTAADWEAALDGLPEAEAERRRGELALALLGADRPDDAARQLELLSSGRAAPLVELRDAVRAADADDASDETLLAAAKAWARAGRNDRAEQLYRRLEARGAQPNPVLVAEALQKQGRLRDAIARLEGVDFERHPVAALTLARYYLAAARYADGVALLERTRPLHTGALAEPARALCEELRHEDETYTRALRAMRGQARD